MPLVQLSGGALRSIRGHATSQSGACPCVAFTRRWRARRLARMDGGARMTNGAVGAVSAGKGGLEMEVAYECGKRHIIVSPKTPVQVMSPGIPQTTDERHRDRSRSCAWRRRKHDSHVRQHPVIRRRTDGLCRHRRSRRLSDRLRFLNRLGIFLLGRHKFPARRPGNSSLKVTAQRLERGRIDC
jgi:hypothetical protein